MSRHVAIEGGESAPGSESDEADVGEPSVASDGVRALSRRGRPGGSTPADEGVLLALAGSEATVLRGGTCGPFAWRDSMAAVGRAVAATGACGSPSLSPEVFKRAARKLLWLRLWLLLFEDSDIV